MPRCCSWYAAHVVPLAMQQYRACVVLPAAVIETLIAAVAAAVIAVVAAAPCANCATEVYIKIMIHYIEEGIKVLTCWLADNLVRYVSKLLILLPRSETSVSFSLINWWVCLDRVGFNLFVTLNGSFE